jgi:hypothetical protein
MAFCLVVSYKVFIFILYKRKEIMEHQIIILKADINGIKTGTKGTIVFDYGRHMFEVEFIINGKSTTEMIHENDFNLFNNIIN